MSTHNDGTLTQRAGPDCTITPHCVRVLDLRASFLFPSLDFPLFGDANERWHDSEKLRRMKHTTYKNSRPVRVRRKQHFPSPAHKPKRGIFPRACVYMGWGGGAVRMPLLLRTTKTLLIYRESSPVLLILVGHTRTVVPNIQNCSSYCTEIPGNCSYCTEIPGTLCCGLRTSSSSPPLN